jgi:hypothetical protein
MQCETAHDAKTAPAASPRRNRWRQHSQAPPARAAWHVRRQYVPIPFCRRLRGLWPAGRRCRGLLGGHRGRRGLGMSSRCRMRRRRCLCLRRRCLRRAARLGCRARCAAPRRPRWAARWRRAAWRSWAASGAPSGGEHTWRPMPGGLLPTPRRPARTGVATRAGRAAAYAARAPSSRAVGGCSRDNGATSAGSSILEAIVADALPRQVALRFEAHGPQRRRQAPPACSEEGGQAAASAEAAAAASPCAAATAARATTTQARGHPALMQPPSPHYHRLRAALTPPRSRRAQGSLGNIGGPD